MNRVLRSCKVGDLKTTAHKLTDEAAGEKVRLLQALHDGEQLRSRIVEVRHSHAEICGRSAHHSFEGCLPRVMTQISLPAKSASRAPKRLHHVPLRSC